jgi:hypothetical protein
LISDLTHRQHRDPISYLSFRAEQTDAFSSLPLPRKVGLRREKSLFASNGSFAGLLLRWFRPNLLLCSGLLVLTIALLAQAPTAVPVAKEPHHHLVFENDYVRVFRVSIPGHDTTLLHQHDLPYVYVSLGPADVINAVAGKPEAHLVMADGQVGYSRGGFAHIARTDAGSPFNNVTIELLKPQGEPQNICAEVVPGAPQGSCPKTLSEKRNGASSAPLFLTEEMGASLTRLDPDVDQNGISSNSGTLFVLLSGSGIQTMVKGKPEETLAVGDVRWLLAGSNNTFSNPAHKAWSYLTLGFKGSEALHKY